MGCNRLALMKISENGANIYELVFITYMDVLSI